MRNFYLKVSVVMVALPLLYLADVTPGSSPGLSLGRQAQAIVGAPLTPVSVAGVARRTTVRAVAATSAAQASAATAAQQQQATAQQQAAAQQQATAQQMEAATKQLQTATEQQQASTEQLQAATEQLQAATARPAGAPAIGTVVSTLPEGCQLETRDGIAYQNCGGVFFRPAFQGNNLVYVAQ